VISTMPRSSKHIGSVVVDGVEGCQVKFAKCCNPLPGDRLIAFVTKGFGISVHKTDCENIVTKRASGEDPDRFKRAEWVDSVIAGTQSRIFEAVLHINAISSYSLIAEITAVLAEMRVSILQMNTQNKNDKEVNITLTIACKNLDHLYSIQSKLRSIRDVERVTRL